MPDNTEFLKYKLTIDTTTAEAYRAFTSPTALSEWLCNQATIRFTPSGSYYLWWQNGYFVTGTFIELTPEKRVCFSWMGRDDPGLSDVCVTIKPKPEGVQITLTHNGLGSGKNWKKARRDIDRGWQEALENLKMMLENGQDLRLLRRPMMGITGCDAITKVSALKHNFPKTNGVLLYGVIEGMGAQIAGLQPGDILVKMGDTKLSRDVDLTFAIGQHKAGDKVKVTYYRNGEKQSTELIFSERMRVDVPPNPADLVKEIDAMYKPFMTKLESMLKGISEEKALAHPAPGEWNVKQVLAHLIATEKDTHTWIGALLEDRDSGFEYHVNKTERLDALIAACPNVSALIKDLKRNVAETIAFITNLPEEFVAHKRSYNRLGEDIFSGSFHYQDHIEQIKKLI